jgi:hypothetical protein
MHTISISPFDVLPRIERPSLGTTKAEGGYVLPIRSEQFN